MGWKYHNQRGKLTKVEALETDQKKSISGRQNDFQMGKDGWRAELLSQELDQGSVSPLILSRATWVHALNSDLDMSLAYVLLIKISGVSVACCCPTITSSFFSSPLLSNLESPFCPKAHLAHLNTTTTTHRQLKNFYKRHTKKLRLAKQHH